jgi:DNA-binding MarR family transcriptional regulator
MHEPNDAVGFLLWRTLTAYRRRIEAVLDEVGLTHLQFAVLISVAWLGRQNAEVRQRDIMQQSGIQEAQVSLMIKTLRKKGYLTQEPGERDPRVRSIVVTDAGEEVLAAALPRIERLQKELWPSAEIRRDAAALLTATLHRWGEL